MGLHRIEDGLRRDTQVDQLSIIKLQEYAFRTLTQHQRFFNTLDPFQPVPHGFHFTGQLAHRQPWRRHGDQAEINIGKIIINQRADHSRRHVYSLVIHTLADIREAGRQLTAGCVIVKLYQQVTATGTGGGLDLIQIRHLLDFLFQRPHHLILQLLWRGARPDDRDHHHPHGE